MNDQQKAIAQACLEAAESNSMTFPRIVSTLIDRGFESYTVDFRRAIAAYYLPDGDCIELPTHRVDTPVAHVFDAARMQAAIREAQQQVAGYTYRGFCQ